MGEKTKRHKKVSISEEDISTLFQRYTVTTVLALLQEVAQVPDEKIDWNALVKRTSTGISNAREYQMLWRHLAYREALLDEFGEGAELLDDESDLDCELEAVPTVSCDASIEAAACVKVLIASGLPSDSSIPNSSTVEAPLTINIPNGQSSRAATENSQPSCSVQGMNITVPVSVQKLPLPMVTPAEALDANGSASGNMPPRRKRKPWSEAEDMELIAAVQKRGEGNWANILKGDFRGDRTASQLSQRWAIIRKRHGNLIVGGSNSSGTQLSEAQLAARHAVSLALDRPVKNLTGASTVGSAGTASNTTSSNSVFPTTAAEASLAGSSSIVQPQHQSQQNVNPTRLSPMESMGLTAKSRLTSKKVPVKSNFSLDPRVIATAVIAGARIASPSDAASLLRAQAKSPVHIMPIGGSLIKSSMPGGAATHLGSHQNVKYASTSRASAPFSTYPTASTIALLSASVKGASPVVQHTPSASPISPNMSSEQTNAVNTGTELPSKQELKAAEEIKVLEPDTIAKENVPDGSYFSGNVSTEQDGEDKAVLPDVEAEFKDQAAVVDNTNCSSDTRMDESDEVAVTGNSAEVSQSANDNKMIGLPLNEGIENSSVVEENSEKQSTIVKKEDLPCIIADRSSERLEEAAAAGKAAAAGSEI